MVKNKKAAHGSLFGALASAYDLGTDLIFLATLLSLKREAEGGELDTLVFVSVASIIATIVVNAVSVGRIIATEMSNDEFSTWAKSNAVALGAVCVLGSTNATSLLLLRSAVFRAPAFSAPVSEDSVASMRMAGILSNLF